MVGECQTSLSHGKRKGEKGGNSGRERVSELMGEGWLVTCQPVANFEKGERWEGELWLVVFKIWGKRGKKKRKKMDKIRDTWQSSVGGFGFQIHYLQKEPHKFSNFLKLLFGHKVSNLYRFNTLIFALFPLNFWKILKLTQRKFTILPIKILGLYILSPLLVIHLILPNISIT